MTKQFFIFSRMLTFHDRRLVRNDHDQAYAVCWSAYCEYCDSNITMESWIVERYDKWLSKFVYMSEHMPENCKQILIGK